MLWGAGVLVSLAGLGISLKSKKIDTTKRLKTATKAYFFRCLYLSTIDRYCFSILLKNFLRSVAIESNYSVCDTMLLWEVYFFTIYICYCFGDLLGNTFPCLK